MEISKEDQKLLSEMSYSDDIIKLTRAVGHSSIPRMLEKDVSTEEQVMHYIDIITSGSEIVSVDERIDVLEANPRYQKLNEEGRDVHSGRTYFQVAREVAKVIEEKIANQLNLQQPADLPSFIKNAIKEKIISHSK